MRRAIGMAAGMMGLAGLAVAGMAQPGADAGAAPTSAPLSSPSRALATMEPGAWHLRMISGASGTPADICVGDLRQLVQLRHANAPCEHFVATDEPRVATVSYTCQGVGSGRTTLRMVPDGSIRIDSQGVAGREPFAFVAEARRTGGCSGTAVSNAATPAR